MAKTEKNLLDGQGITCVARCRQRRETHDRLHSGIRLPPHVKEHRTFITCDACLPTCSETET